MHPALLRSDCAISITEPQADRTNPLIWANERWSELTGYSLASMLGRDPHCAHSGIAPEAQQAIRYAVHNQGRCSVLAQLRRLDGSTVWARETIYPACDGLNAVAVFNDWTPAFQRRLQSLSRTQERLLALLGNGYDVKAAARVLGVCERVARYHRKRLLLRLGIGDLRALSGNFLSEMGAENSLSSPARSVR